MKPRDAVMTEHPDKGCEFSRSCLACPLPLCKDDMEPIELHRLRQALKARHIKAVGAQQGSTGAAWA